MAGDNGGKEWRGKREEWREALKENGKAAYCLLFLFPSHSLARDVVVCSCPVLSVLNQSLSLSHSIFAYIFTSQSQCLPPVIGGNLIYRPPTHCLLLSYFGKEFLAFSLSLTHSVTLSPSPSLYCLALILVAIGR